MGRAIGTFILWSMGVGFLAIPWVLTLRLTPEKKRHRILRWLLVWSIKGVLLPLAIWAAINIGLAWNLQPFMPEIQAARNRGGSGWIPVYVHVCGLGLWMISTYWCAVTLCWVLGSAATAADEKSRKEFKELCLTWLLGLGLPVAIILIFGGTTFVGFAATLLLAPVASYSRDILQPRKMPPMYSRAIARMKFGKYSEAEWEIIRQLEDWEDDFEGWMMLADLYANHFHNLDEAEQTIRDLCDQPKTTPSQFAVALHRLADWQLKLAKDPDAARRCLLLICERMKGTHLAHMAQLRINQLPASSAELREQQTTHVIPLPALGDQMDEQTTFSPLDKEKAAATANSYVEQLKQNPNNTAARERLARLLTERLEKPQLGIEQIQLLLEMPDRSDAEKAEWLGLMGAWYIKHTGDMENGRQTLERLVREFPDSVHAFAARRRLELLDRQLKQSSR